ncbi:MAG TPA: fumarylacetoacetate hydrolase family protein [Bacillales bacterium]|nr:fumarylacetoacetate hydrolase family protein [Bacillales bacterium]
MEKETLKSTATFLENAETQKTEVTRITADRHPDLSLDEAYQIQRELVNLKLERGHKIIGPKMGLTSEAKMKQMNVSDPIYGYVFDYMVLSNGETLATKELIHPKVEPEVAFILKEDVQGPGITGAQILQATEYVFPALEIIDSRYENFNFTLPDVIADNTSASRVIFGSDLRKSDDLELDLIGVTLSINGEIKSLGASAAVLGHPAHSVARLANMLARNGETLKAGQPILTGGITAAIRLAPGDYVSAKLDGLGEVACFVE